MGKKQLLKSLERTLNIYLEKLPEWEIYCLESIFLEVKELIKDIDAALENLVLKELGYWGNTCNGELPKHKTWKLQYWIGSDYHIAFFDTVKDMVEFRKRNTNITKYSYWSIAYGKSMEVNELSLITKEQGEQLAKALKEGIKNYVSKRIP